MVCRILICFCGLGRPHQYELWSKLLVTPCGRDYIIPLHFPSDKGVSIRKIDLEPYRVCF